MKKIFYILAIIATLSLAACRKTPIGGSAVQDLSGEWYVQVDIVDENGEVVEDETRSNIKICHPFFTELVDQCVQYMLSGKESRYALVIGVAKRARQISDEFW